VQELLLPIAQYVSEVKVTDAMIKAFYDKNSKFFEIPEQAKIEYVVLDDSAAGEQVDVTEADVTGYYAKNQKAYTTPEARQASHILVAVKKDASAADKAAAKAKAEAILADVRKTPASFAAVAKAKSEDPASAEQGGDLGVIGKDGLPAPLLSAVSKLKQGEISDVVASDFGYHILTVTSLKPQHVKALDEVRGEITADLRKQFAAKKYSEMAENVHQHGLRAIGQPETGGRQAETESGKRRQPVAHAVASTGQGAVQQRQVPDRHLLERFLEGQAQTRKPSPLHRTC